MYTVVLKDYISVPREFMSIGTCSRFLICAAILRDNSYVIWIIHEVSLFILKRSEHNVKRKIVLLYSILLKNMIIASLFNIRSYFLGLFSHLEQALETENMK